MFIKRSTLAQAGLEVNLDKHGLSIQGTGKLPEAVEEALHGVARDMEFDPEQHDRLFAHVCDAGVWKALRNCPTEI